MIDNPKESKVKPSLVEMRATENSSFLRWWDKDKPGLSEGGINGNIQTPSRLKVTLNFPTLYWIEWVTVSKKEEG